MWPERLPVVGCAARGPLEVGDPLFRILEYLESVPTNGDDTATVTNEVKDSNPVNY